MNRLPVENIGDHLLCLSVEPFAEDFWLKPGESLVVVPSADDVAPQFSVHARTDRNHLTVWIYEAGDSGKVLTDFTVLDAKGRAVDCGYQRPEGAIVTASDVFLLPKEAAPEDIPDSDRSQP
ncbi:hypothetical protein ACQEU3_39790 [Spirillospora sp. CA-253888]